jgi:hypothetical protein
VLGFSFLKDRIIQIDYPNSKLRFFAESPYPRIQFSANTVNTIAFPFKREDGEVIIDSVYVTTKRCARPSTPDRAARSVSRPKPWRC